MSTGLIASVNQSKVYTQLLTANAMTTSEEICDEHVEAGSFARGLEERASNLLSSRDQQRPEVSVSSFITENIALTLDQIERQRLRGREIFESLLESECYIGTELIQMEQRTPRYTPYRFPEREKLQRRLGEISKERRRFVVSDTEKLDALHSQLLAFLTKHRQVNSTWRLRLHANGKGLKRRNTQF